MALRVSTATKNEIALSLRFEPKLYFFQSTLNKAKQKYEFVPLSRIANDIKRGQSPKPETYKDEWGGKYIFLRTADVKKYNLSTEGVVWLDEETFKTQKANRIQKGDLLVSVVGNYLGSTSVIPSNIELGAFNDNSAKVHIIDERFSPYFVACFFNSVFGQHLILSKCTRTGQKILSAGNLKTLEIPLILGECVSESARECAELDVKSNSLIRQARELFYSRVGIDFKAIKKNKFFSANVKDFADTDLWSPAYSYPLYVNTNAALKNKWQVIPLREITDLTKGDEVGSDNYIGYLDKCETDVPFIRTSDIINYETDQYPDFYIPVETYQDIAQDIKARDVIFSKDGKIGQVGMITDYEKAIIASGFCALRLNKKAKEYGVTPEYLFTVLSIKEIGRYESKRRSVVASTIPHLREERIKEMEIPILDEVTINEISDLVLEAFKLKAQRKRLIAEVRKTINSYFDI